MTRQDINPISLDPDLDPWERQPGESPKRYGQFATYRDLGRTRTMAKVAETLTLNPGYVRQVGAAMQWTARAEAYDLHRDRMHEAVWLEERRKAAEADGKLLGAVMGKLVQRLGSLQAEQLSPAEFTRLLDVVLRQRRTLFGDPQMTVAVTGPGGEPLAAQVAEFVAMGAEQQRRAVQDMVDSVQRRLAAADGAVDDD
jgi:hypothetical protein